MPMLCPAASCDQRWKPIVRLSVLLAIWGCVALSNPAGMVLEDNSLIRPYLPYVWFGAYLALPSLLAIWVALVQQRPIVRVLQVLGVAALLGTIASWGPGVSFFVGYLAALLGSLEVVRSCGFELARGNGNIPSG